MQRINRKYIQVVLVCLPLAIITLYYDRHTRIVAVMLPNTSDKGLTEELPADDPRVIAFIRERVLVAPSTAPYNLQHGPDLDTSDGQAQIIDNILGGKRNGFFVECGAFTGDVMSNTLLFETQRGWKGLLIEPDKSNFAKIISRNRKVHAANSCLGESKGPQSILYSEDRTSWTSKIIDPSNVLYTDMTRTLSTMTCYPLESFLLAMNTSTVDYLSLDVESSEYKVLQSTNWDRLDIKTLSVEWNLIPEGRDALRELMESKGYIFYMEFNKIHTHDFIFVKKGILSETEAGKKLPILRIDSDPKQLIGRDLKA